MSHSAIVEIAALSSLPGYFSATKDGATLVAKSLTPLCDSARALLTTANSTYSITMRHTGSSHDALRTTIGHAASLAVVNDPRRGPIFVRHKGRTGAATCVISSDG
jgi:hypothetical protein